MLAAHLLALASLASDPLQAPAVYSVPLGELELAAGAVLPSYGGYPPWAPWGDALAMPRVVLEGEGEAVYAPDDVDGGLEPEHALALGRVVARTAQPREVRGTLQMPKSSGGGFLRIPFSIPAARATASEDDFRAAELAFYGRMLAEGLPGSAWFRHREDALTAELAGKLPAAAEPAARWSELRAPEDALSLFSGGRALWENLQLERGLPAAPPGEATVALDSLEGITVRAIDWAPRIAPGEIALDPLAGCVPADQHALFFPTFGALVTALDESARLGELGLALFGGRGSDARTRERTERQLCLALDDAARALGPLAIRGVALTGSDPYLRSGSDLAFLFLVEPRGAAAVAAVIRGGQERSGFALADGARGERAAVSLSRHVSSYLLPLEGENGGAGAILAVSNSAVQLERVRAASRGEAPTLASAGEYRFFRQRYARGAESETALLVVPDDAIRRWCSPRWRIASARRVRAAAQLADEHAKHAERLLAGVAEPVALGVDPDFPDLGALTLSADGVHSAASGSLDFLTPIAELPLESVTQREAELYRLWKDGYERAWSNYFDPIGARLSVTPERTALDLTVMPLILGTEYADLRAATRGPGLLPGAGDPHPEALIRFAMALDPDWEELDGFESVLGGAAAALGADPLAWLGGWVAVYVDEGEIWDELLQAEDMEEALEGAQGALNELPIAVVIAVRNPMKLALFLTALRGLVDGTAPGMTEWKERAEGERRFVEISSPGFGEELSLFYATTPSALILSLHEPTLLSAMGREEARRAPDATAPPGAGSSHGVAHATLELSGRGLELVGELLGDDAALELRRSSWRALPILNEWRRLHPERDPLETHELVLRERLECPGGGRYVWNEDWQTMESTVLGHPGEPKLGRRLPAALDELEAARFSLEFEDDGLRVRAELDRK